MAESDEECDRRRGRDKFRRERSDYQDRREERGRRDDWTDNNRDNRNSGARRSGDYRDYGGRRDRYSPSRHEMSPPMKRVRRDWDDRGYMGGNYDSGYNSSMVSGHHSGWGHESVGMASNSSMYRQGGYRDDQGPTQPPMMSFKQFLSSQDDAIDDQEAVKKYGEYKLDFTRQQLNEFFLNHKEEEWFKLKYHPEDSQKRQIEQIAALKKRLETFHELNESNSMNVTLDVDQSEKIIKLLDSVVIKLEGGSDFDLKALDMPFEEPKRDVSPRREASTSVNSRKVPPSEAPQERQGGKKRKKRGRGYDSDEDSGSESESGEESEKENPEPPKPAAEEEEKPKEDDKETSPDEQKVSDEDAIDVNEQDKSENPIEEIKAPEEKNEIEKKEDEVVKKEEEEAKPKPLHRTCSIFLRNLAPTITKQEVEAMCKRYPGFLRAAIADPTPERRFFRRGWVTFERSVNIKDICWNLNNIRLRECELGAIVNRDLSRRIRSISGIAAHKQVARADIKIAAKIIQNLDQKRNLWKDGPSSDKVENGSVQSFGLESSNPLLKNITDYLIEEASAEEEELLGTSDIEDKDKNGDYILEKDDSLIRVLDKLILYLRIVHSVDYYNCSEYPAEDEMPNRCGIIHARGAIPSSKVSQQEVNDFIKQFETKISSFLVPYSTLTDEEAMKLGQKNAEIEVENFIKANTQELAKDKWLCPLSGKKFKGPDFVRKHIFNKHGEKVDEVKKEVEYFNNYLMDQKRPQLPEHSGSTKSRGGYSHGNHEGMHGNHHQTMNVSSGSGYGHHHGYQGGYSSRNAYNDPYGRSAGYGHKRGYSGGDSHRRTSGGRRNTYRNDPREIVGYHDLDAPQDVDIF